MKFKIVIGDWSDDGHGHTEDFWYEANKTIEEVREAYFAARKSHPKLCPETFCNEYDEGALPEDVEKNLRAAGCPLPKDTDSDWCPGAMAEVVVWFLQLGDPLLVLVEIPQPEATLHFYGSDKKKRHIDPIGYGMFTD